MGPRDIKEEKEKRKRILPFWLANIISREKHSAISEKTIMMMKAIQLFLYSRLFVASDVHDVVQSLKLSIAGLVVELDIFAAVVHLLIQEAVRLTGGIPGRNSDKEANRLLGFCIWQF